MDPKTALYGSIILVTVHLILVALLSLYRSGSSERAETTAGPEPAGAVDRDAETVTCPNCGADNELGYRYCARCIDELPGAVTRPPSSVAPGRRELF